MISLYKLTSYAISKTSTALYTAVSLNCFHASIVSSITLMHAFFSQATSLTASKASRRQRARRTNPVKTATAKRKAGAAKKTRAKDNEAGCFHYLHHICTVKLSRTEAPPVNSAKAKSSSASAESSCGSQMSRRHRESPTRSSRRQPRRSQSQPAHHRRRHRRYIAFCIQAKSLILQQTPLNKLALAQ